MKGNQLNGEAVTAEMLEAKGYKKYHGEGIDIYYNKDICAHIGNCVRVSDCRPSADAGTCGRNYGRCIHSDEGGKGEQGIHRH